MPQKEAKMESLPQPAFQDANETPESESVVLRHEMHEYKPRNATGVVNADPNYIYRLLSKSKIDRDGGDTRDWEIVKGNMKERLEGAPENIEEVMHDLGVDKQVPKGMPWNTGDQDTTRSRGNLVLGRQRKEWGKSREKHYSDMARERVESTLVRDKQDRAELISKTLRDSGVSKSDTERLVRAMGGVREGKSYRILNGPLVMNQQGV